MGDGSCYQFIHQSCDCRWQLNRVASKNDAGFVSSLLDGAGAECEDSGERDPVQQQQKSGDT